MTSCAANLPTKSKKNIHVIVQLWSTPCIGISYFKYGRAYVVYSSVISVTPVTDITLSLLLPALAAIMSPRL
jgi:hypothetical protein